MARKNILETFIEIIILAAFVPVMFWLSLLTGLAYVLAIVLAIRSKTLFRRKRMARLIILGTFLSTVAGILLFWGLDLNAAGEATSALILLAVAGYVWWKGFRMKKGKR